MKVIALILLLSIVSVTTVQKDMYENIRNDMVDKQLVSRGIKDAAILNAMRKVPRHLFVPEEIAGYAYEDTPLEIGYGQTISQPYIVAFMTECAAPSLRKRALEIGTGSGYQAAVLSEVADSVYSVEIIHELAVSAAARLRKLGYNNVMVREGDGYAGWPEHAPFDIIMVTAAPDVIPQPLIEQLAEGGRLIIPVGKPHEVQKLIMLKKENGEIIERKLTLVRFVPLTRYKDN